MPQLIEVPGVGAVEFPDGMDDAAIVRAIERDNLQRQQQAAATTSERAGAMEKAADFAYHFVRGVTPQGMAENLGLIGNYAGNVASGATRDLITQAGNLTQGGIPAVSVTFPEATQALAGQPVTTDPTDALVNRGLQEGARSLGPMAVASGLTYASGGVIPPPAALGAAFGSSTYAQTGDPTAAAKSAGIGMVIPAAAQAGRVLGAQALGAAVNRGLLSADATLVQKGVEVLASQGGVQALMEGMNLDEYLSLPYEQRKEMFLQNLVANTAFLAMDVPHLARRGPSATQQRMGPQGMANARVAEVMRDLVNNPQALDALQARVDEAAFDRLNAANAQELAPARTFPEPNATIEAQLQAMREGRKGAVEVTSQTEPVSVPEGVVATTVEGRTFLHDPKQTPPETIKSAVADGTIANVMGYSTTEKPADGTVVAQGRNADGVPVHEEVANAETLPAAVAAAKQMAGDGGTVQVVPPEQVIQERAQGEPRPVAPSEQQQEVETVPKYLTPVLEVLAAKAPWAKSITGEITGWKMLERPDGADLVSPDGTQRVRFTATKVGSYYEVAKQRALAQAYAQDNIRQVATSAPRSTSLDAGNSATPVAQLNQPSIPPEQLKVAGPKYNSGGEMPAGTSVSELEGQPIDTAPVKKAAAGAADVGVEKQNQSTTFPPAATGTVTEPATPRKRQGQRARKVFDNETEMVGPDILSFIVESGGMVSPTRARQTRGNEWWTANKSLYDDKPQLQRPTHAIIYGSDRRPATLLPDQLAQAAFDAGVLPSPDVPALWAAVDAASRSRAGAYKQQRAQDAAIDQMAKQSQRFSKSVRKGKVAADAERLAVGDVLIVEGTELKVTERDPETGALTLEDGTRFGTQTLPDGETIYVEEIREARQDTTPKLSSAKLDLSAKEVAALDRKINAILETPPEQRTAAQVAELVKLEEQRGQGTLLDSKTQGDNPRAKQLREQAAEMDRLGTLAQQRYFAGSARGLDEAKAAFSAAAELRRQATELEGVAADRPELATSPEEMPFNIEQATLPRRVEGDTPAPDISGGKPVALADIRKYLAKALDIPVRLGVNRRRALGFFTVKPETIRLKAINDIPTLAHEVGHYLHFILFPRGGVRSPGNLKSSDFAKTFDSELLALGARTSRPSYTQHQVRQEGVAEHLREWMTDRSIALAKAPRFTAFFESELQGKFPEVWKIVTQARKDLGRYINQPAIEKARSLIAWAPEDERVPLTRRMQTLYDNWVNDLQPIERALRSLEPFGLDPRVTRGVVDYAVNYIGGWRGKAQASIEHRQTDFNGNDIGPSLKEIMSGVDSYQDLAIYGVAKRTLELAARKQPINTGLDVSDARDIVAKLGGQYDAKSKQLTQFSQNSLALLRDSGLLSDQQYRQITSANLTYIPLHRVMENITGTGSGGGGKGGFINLDPGVQTIRGSERQIVNPLESIVKNAYVFRDLAERNRVGRLFANAIDSTRGGGRIADQIARKIKPTTVTHDEMVKALEDAGINTSTLLPAGVDLTFKVWRAAKNADPKSGIFTVYRDGKEQAYQMDDPELYRALALADATQAKFFAEIPGFKPMRALTTALRAGSTLTLEFIARNPFRDQVTAGVYSKHGFVPFFDGFRGLFSAIKRDDLYWKWVNSGGRYSDFLGMDRNSLNEAIQALPENERPLALRLADPRNIISNLQKFSELMEQATRISEFRRAKEAGLSDIEAANASKDVTLNFARGGFRGKLVNQLSAFFNASVQDIDKFARAHQERPVQTMAKAFAYITAPSLLAWYLGKDDKEIQNLPAWRKNLFWNVNLRTLAQQAGIETGDFVLSFPKPFLLGQIYGSSVERALDYATERDPNAAKKWFGGLIESTPVNPLVWLPTAIRPPIEAAANYSFFRGQPIESQALQDLPPELRANPDTSATAKTLAQLMPFEITSPARIDNTVRGYFGGLGRYGTAATDWAMAKAKLVDIPPAPAKSAAEMPLLRAFTRSPYEASAFVERFYKGAELAEQKLAVAKNLPLVINGDAAKFIEKNPEDVAFYHQQTGRAGQARMRITQLREARAQLSEIGKAMQVVQSSRDLSPEEKREKLIALARMRDQLAEAAFKQYLSPNDQAKAF